MTRRLKKQLARSLCRSFLFRWGVALADKASWRDGLLRVLTYHRIDHLDARHDLDPSLISATPDQFRRQLDWLNRDFDPVSIADVLAAKAGTSKLPRRAVLLTFDDAYLDFQQHAWPELQARNTPVALFVPTAFPDNPDLAFWWDRLYCAIVLTESRGQFDSSAGLLDLTSELARRNTFRHLKQQLKSLSEQARLKFVNELCERFAAPTPAPAVMSWQALREVANEGVELAPHTHTHPLLDRVTPETAFHEVCQSRDLLTEKTGPTLPAFAYPSGHYNSEVAGLVANAGMQLAFTTERGINRLDSIEPMQLRRCNISQHTPDSLVRFQLTDAFLPMQPKPRATCQQARSSKVSHLPAAEAC